MNIINTRDLIETRDELREEIFNSFTEIKDELFTQDEINDGYWYHYDDVDWDLEVLEDFKNTWADEFASIKEIDDIENEIGSEFKDGVQLIDEDNFEEYCTYLLEDLGYIPKDFPSWIEIDWEATASNMRSDYSEVEFDGVTYLYRA